MTECILNEGRNCWRIAPATRVGFLVDGASYYQAFREAAMQAHHSLLILAWDFDSRVSLVGDGKPDGFPASMGEFLHELLARRRSLHIYVLTWDYHFIYALEREWWPLSRLGLHRRMHLHKDGNHPLGASQHQKVVVIDDAVAFAGGLDFAQCRWDTTEHRANHPARRFPDGRHCRPFHDVQMLVEGAAAQSLGELARARWRRATGRRLSRPKGSGEREIWPASVKPDMEKVQVAIARTEPEHAGRPEVREVERLFLDSIQSAQHSIYIETQYLTSEVICCALAVRLEQPRGPEVIVVLHPSSDGWLEQHTMDVLRGRILKRLRAADRYQRLGLYCPHLPGLIDQCISMHSKVFIVDDDFVRVGSANLSNRSMGFDTECDLAVVAGGDSKIRQCIAGFRNRLLGEHLDVAPGTVARSHADERSLIAAVEQLRGRKRTLNGFDRQIPSDVDSWIPDADVIDPSRPIPDVMSQQFISNEERPPARRQIIMGVSVLAALVVMAAAWRWTPLGQWLDLPSLVAYVAGFQHSPSAPFITIAGFVIGGLAVVPVTILIAATVLAFGPLWGFAYSFVGMTLSALTTFWIGHLIGSQIIQRLTGSRIHKLSRRLAQRGVLAVIAVRALPVAPFTIVNMVAGASHIRLREFFIGTVIGELPGLIGLALFVDQISTTIHEPGIGSFFLLTGVVAAIVLASIGLHRWLGKEAPDPSSSGATKTDAHSPRHV
ncbi:MAG: VTT domain-containing protein [Nitrospiraceae bacterium]